MQNKILLHSDATEGLRQIMAECEEVQQKEATIERELLKTIQEARATIYRLMDGNAGHLQVQKTLEKLNKAAKFISGGGVYNV